MTTNLKFVPRRTINGLLMLLVGLAITALSGSVLLPTSLSTDVMEQMTTGMTSPPLWITIFGCLTPLALILQIIALFVIASEAKQFDKDTAFTANLGAILFLAATIISIGVSIGLSLKVASEGSLVLAVLSATLISVLSVFGILGLALVLYPYAAPGLKKAIVALAVLQGIATLAASYISTSSMRIREIEIQTITRYFAQPNTGGLYPALTIIALVCSWGMVAITAILFVRYSRLAKEMRVESVA